LDNGRFNIRVYGLLCNPFNEILIVHESINNFHFSKFPGGGLELGEGPVDCLKREIMEELELECEIEDHYYTTDFYQPSAFNRDDQLIAIYYRLQPLEERIIFEDRMEYENEKIISMRFEWVPLHKLNPQLFTFPVDQLVCEMLIDKSMAS
jgi:8-oxo-dGTP diphosphatase